MVQRKAPAVSPSLALILAVSSGFDDFDVFSLVNRVHEELLEATCWWLLIDEVIASI
jgi:hypothetical protein